jgi:hypothetical protein
MKLAWTIVTLTALFDERVHRLVIFKLKEELSSVY